MEHQHIYDKNGKQLCCTLEEKIYTNAGAKKLLQDASSTEEQNTSSKCKHTKDKKHQHDNTHAHDHDHEHQHEHNNQPLYFVIISALLLALCLSFDHIIKNTWFVGSIRTAAYLISFLPVGIPVFLEAFKSICKGDIFSEFLLMSIATVGAFAIAEYPEAVTVMLFYTIGELFQTNALRKAKKNIEQLIDQRPDTVTVIEGKDSKTIPAKEARAGQIIQLKAGDKLALDGILLSNEAYFNTAALTGEALTQHKIKGDTVLAGMINEQVVCNYQVTKVFEDSKLSNILNLVQNASAQKAPTEKFIRKFSRIYTPIVVILAVLLTILPMFFVSPYNFSEWLYRALVFLVISCPCALVISIPLGYFGGIGAASRKGILIKGGQYLDALARLNHLFLDKTGTITKGAFSVQYIEINNTQHTQTDLLAIVKHLEATSSHPIAKAICNAIQANETSATIEQIKEIPGHGIEALVNAKTFLIGNEQLLKSNTITYQNLEIIAGQSIVYIAWNGQYLGHIVLADQIKDDAQESIQEIKNRGISCSILSGDQQAAVNQVAQQVGIQNAYGNLLPEDKIQKVQAAKSKQQVVAFVGDGVNDAPVVTLSDIGIAMGGLGSDATIESADIVIQNDELKKIPQALSIAKDTQKIVKQNIALAFIVKFTILGLGSFGLATMWEAVFADVGVALLAILNAMRIQQK